MNSASVYCLRPFTNLHVGSGESNFGVVDNLIQRDPATGLPCIHASGLKGAIKQLCDYKKMEPGVLKEIFGSDAEANKPKVKKASDDEATKVKIKDAQQGKAFFMSAQLYAIARPMEQRPYQRVTCQAVKDLYAQFLSDLGLNVAQHNIGFGDVDSIDDAAFVELCDDLNLPVIARNALDNGESVNLWYEQVLPRESLLYFAILWEKDEHKKALEAILLNNPLQVGGNASVGYGFTKVTLCQP